MSDMSDILADALAVIAEFKGEALTYSATKAGIYSALTGFTVNIDRVDAIRSNDEMRVEEQWETATLKGPLTPALATGYFVKDTLNADRLWYVEGVKTDQQQVVRLRRITQGAVTPNRGGSR